MSYRIHARHPIVQRASFDFFTMGNGRKHGLITDISQGGCLLRSSEPLEPKRFLRMIVQDDERKMGFTLVGRITRRESKLEAVGDEMTLYRYGIEFTYPGCLANQDLDMILALSSKNLSVRSCLMRNNKSSLRSEFLA